MTTEPQLYRYRHHVKMSICNAPNENYVVLTTPAGNRFAITKSDFNRDYKPVQPTCKSSLQVEGWRAIDECPKNEVVLLYTPKRMISNVAYMGVTFGIGKYVPDDKIGWKLLTNYYQDDPTHFMRLPPPPREE